MAPTTDRDHPVLRWLRRLYLALSVVTFVLVSSLFVDIAVVSEGLAGVVFACWIVASLFALGHVGIRNTTHGV
jgi:hypothetical protein